MGQWFSNLNVHKKYILLIKVDCWIHSQTFWFSRTFWVRAKSLYFHPGPKWCWGCWSGDNNLKTNGIKWKKFTEDLDSINTPNVEVNLDLQKPISNGTKLSLSLSIYVQFFYVQFDIIHPRNLWPFLLHTGVLVEMWV